MAPGTICIIGLGYIGLPTAAILADAGCPVVGVDTSPRIVETVNAGGIHIIEPELDAVVRRVVASGQLRATTQPVAGAAAYVICVPTPVDHTTHAPDLSYVAAAARAVAQVALPGCVVILESTSPPGTTEQVVGPALMEGPAGLRPGENCHLAYCPERVLPGAILKEAVQNDRVVGGLTPACAEAAAVTVYRKFVRGQILLTTARVAETTKLVENASRDVQIAFANELSLIARRLGVDVWEVIRLANRHPRVNVLQPGPGVGGHCIAVDPWFLIDAAPEEAQLLRTARERNDAMPEASARRIAAAVGAQRASGAAGTAPPVVVLLGLAYKADIDDCRESPSLEVVRHVRHLLGPAARLVACEPNVAPQAAPAVLAEPTHGCELMPLHEALELWRGAPCSVLAALVPHRQFCELGARQLTIEQSDLRIIDFRNCLAK